MIKTISLYVLAVSSVVMGVSQPVWAQSTPVPAMPTAAAPLFNPNGTAPDIATIPVLTNIVKEGAKLYYMGERSGLHGWFIIKNGQIQMIYLSPDQQTVLIGGMFSSKGENVTTPQIQALLERNNEVKQLMSGSAQQQREIYKAGEAGGAGSVPAGVADKNASKNVGGLPSVSASPGERLMQDLKAAAGVTVGQSDNAELMMIVAPSCPNCKKTWQELRESVRANKLQVRLIPVYMSLGGEESRVASQLLRVQNPLEAWDRYVEGDGSLLEGGPDDTAMRAVVSNINLVTKWNIQGYPYLVYRGKDGRIKIVQGRPERMAALLADLGR